MPTVPTSTGFGTGPDFEGSGELGGFSPSDLQSAYNLPETGGTGQTVAIVDAYDDPNAYADLKTYRAYYKLPECTEASGCFSKVNQKGEPKNYPAVSPVEDHWWVETSLDLDMVSAACPKCHILLVEANTSSNKDLYASEDEAATLNATEISNSWGHKEVESETAEDTHFNRPGIPVTFSVGDSGYGVQYPAASQYVISVGGTKLTKAANARKWSEEVWSGTGSGCSAYESKPAWQTDAGCTMRIDNDVAMVASPESPVSVYDTYEHPAGWENLGGTSVGAPLVAGAMAQTNKATRSLPGADAFYQKLSSVFDITAGSNGTCAPEVEYWCTATTGYDGPTGLGSLNGLPAEAWELLTTPNPSGATASRLLGASCSSASACTAVGYDYNAAGTQVPLAERWNGTSWSEQSPVTPAGAESTELLGVSCASSTACTAVGYYYKAGNRLTLAEGWNGTSWSIQTTASPGSRNIFLGVSCTVASACTAVGGYFEKKGTQVTFVERWNGTSWSEQKSPNPTESIASVLHGVSCTSSTACTAAGAYVNSAGTDLTLAESWNGSKWTVQTTPNPSGATFSALYAVSCTSSTACTAAGDYKNSGGTQLTLAERWNGTAWSEQALESPTGAKSEALYGVSCASSIVCTATGYFENSSGTTVTQAQGWNGTKWAIQATPNPIGATASLMEAVSCASTTSCIAPGYFKNSSGTELTMAETYAP